MVYGLRRFRLPLSIDVRGADRTIKYVELPVAYSAALFWPVDLVAMALLKTQ
jgi:hypothetical protein